MVRVVVERTVRCTPEEFLTLVMHPDRYAQVDDKLARIDWVRRNGDVTEFGFRGKLPGLPGPTPKVVSRMRLTAGERVDIDYAPLPRNKIPHRLSTFRASFACTPHSGGTRVTRTIEFGFPRAIAWLVEPILQRTLPPSVEREIAGAKKLLEAEK